MEYYKNELHADKAMEILRAYAGKLKKIYGPDDPLCAGLQGFMLINAAEIMRYTYSDLKYSNGWNLNDTKQVESMFRNVFLPVLQTFIKSEPYSNGNWGISVNKMVMALGIFLDDKDLYNSAIDFFIIVLIMEVYPITFQKQVKYKKLDVIKHIVC